MDFSSEIGKNRRNTGGILRILAYFRRKIGGSYGGHELISVCYYSRVNSRFKQGQGETCAHAFT
jgi:hypothetical protein